MTNYPVKENPKRDPSLQTNGQTDRQTSFYFVLQTSGYTPSIQGPLILMGREGLENRLKNIPRLKSENKIA